MIISYFQFTARTNFNCRYRLQQMDCGTINIVDPDISFQKSVKYLGVRMNQTASMSDHISDVCRSSFLSLRRIGSIRPYLTEKATACLINSILTVRIVFVIQH